MCTQVTVTWAGATASTNSTKALPPSGARGAGPALGIAVEFRGSFCLPVIREGNPDCVNTSDIVWVQLRKDDRTPGKTRTVASAMLSLSDIEAGAWDALCWLNLYGSPRKDDGVALPPSSLLFGDADSPHAEQMNKGTMQGSCFRGRLLLSARLKKMDLRQAAQQAGAPGSSPKQSSFLRSPTRTKKTRSPVPPSPVVPLQMPLMAEFHMRTEVMLGCNLPEGCDVFVRVTWGCCGRVATAVQHTGDGIAAWDSQVLPMAVDFPTDRSQMPEIFVELIHSANHQRTHWCRISVDKFKRTTKSGVYVLAGWVTLALDTVSAGKQPNLLTVEPRILLRMQLDCLENVINSRLQAPQQCRIKAPHCAVKHKLQLSYIGSPMSSLPQFFQFDLRVSVYMGKGLFVSDKAGLSSDPFVCVSVPDVHDLTVRTRNTAVKRQTCNPDFFVQFDWTLMLPGQNCRAAAQLQMAPGVDIAVYDHDGPEAAPELMGRVHIDMQDVAASKWPLWLPLRFPGVTTVVGELLVGIELAGPADPALVSPAPDLRPPSITPPVDISVFLVGCRNLADREGRLQRMVKGATFVEAVLSSHPEVLVTHESAYPVGEHPSYLQQITFKQCSLPSDGQFAPSLTMKICRHSSFTGSREVLGTTELNLSHHLETFIARKQAAVMARTSSPPPRQGRIKQFKKQVSDRALRAGTYKKVNDVSDGTSIDRRVIEKVRAVQDYCGTDATELSFRKGQIISVIKRMQATRRNLSYVLTGFVDNQMGRDNVVGTFPAAVTETVFLSHGGHGHKWECGRGISLDELENVFEFSECACLDIVTAKSYDSDKRSQRSQESSSTLKVYVALTTDDDAHQPNGPLAIGRTLISSPMVVTVRLYVVRAVNLCPRDSNNSCDPFLEVSLDSAVAASGESERWDTGTLDRWEFVREQPGRWPVGSSGAGKEVEKQVYEKSRYPYFGTIFEWTRVLLPGPCQVHLAIKDDDAVGSDMIGTTTVDVEQRFLSPRWRALGVQEPRVQASSEQQPIRKPLERRDLMHGTNSVPQGQIDLWVECFPAAASQAFPLEDISAPKTELFELRVIVWAAKQMRSADVLGGMNDLSFSGHLLVRDHLHHLREIEHHTDTHWRAKKGKGAFNYRMIFQNIELPSHDDDLPRFTLKAWDCDVASSTDQIGSATRSRGVSALFRQAYLQFLKQRRRDEDIGAMSMQQLKSELARATSQNPEVRAALEKRLGTTCSRAQLESRLRDSDRSRQLSSTSVYFTDELDGHRADLSLSHRVFGDDGWCESCTDTVVRAWEQRPRTCCGCVCRVVELAQWLCVRAMTCGCNIVSGSCCSGDRFGPKRPVPSVWWQLHGPVVDDPTTTTDDDDIDAFGYGKVGQVEVSMELLPIELAQLRPAAQGQEAPNQYPKLEPPAREHLLSWNPFKTMSALMGQTMTSKIVALFVCLGGTLLVALMLPMLASNGLSRVLFGGS